MGSDLSIYKKFIFIYEKIENTIPFDLQWKNSRRYTKSLKLIQISKDQLIKSYCTESNRRLMFFGLEGGALIIYERSSFGLCKEITAETSRLVPKTIKENFSSNYPATWYINQIYLNFKDLNLIKV